MKKILLSSTILIFVVLACQNNKKNNFSENQENEKKMNYEPLIIEKFDTIKLLVPEKEFGKTLIEAMWLRKSTREYDETKMLSLKQISDLMWVTNGINRPGETTRNRTVPSAMAKYPIQTYAVLANGIYYYCPILHALIPYLEGDFRKLTGGQDFVEKAPLNIVMFADYSVYNMPERTLTEERKLWYAALDAAHSCQNIYLYCASEGLSTVERAMAPENICETFKLNENHRFIVAQTVGFN